MEYHIRESDVDALWPSLTFFKKMKKQNKKKTTVLPKLRESLPAWRDASLL